MSDPVNAMTRRTVVDRRRGAACALVLVSAALSGCLPFLGGDDGDDAGGDTAEDPCDPEILDWVPMPGGSFTMGTDSGDADEGPAHTVHVDAFEILRFEVTVAQYDACIMDGACPEHPYHCSIYDNYAWSYRAERPMNCVGFSDAADFCAWAGGRLPSEAEWEYAASSGGIDSPYPWGDEAPTPEHAVWFENPYDDYEFPDTAAVCCHPKGRTALGLLDMAGNVAEWVADTYHPSYAGAPDDGSAWTEETGEHVLRGGGHRSYTPELAVTARAAESTSFYGDNNGIRCVR
jgi:formylglycine-generating enzyme required for sulfatase activity